MADISKENYIIRNAVRGEEVRDAIISVITKLNEENFPISAEDIRDILSTGLFKDHQLYDWMPEYGSFSAVTSRGLHSWTLEIDRILDIINGE